MNSSPVLVAENVSFIYPQNKSGLSPVNLTLSENEGVFISGDSGSGKSTLTRCLSGLIPHLYRGSFDGRVLLQGTCTRELPLWESAKRVGLVFQNPAHQMLASTVELELLFGLENLGLKRDEVKHRLEEVVEIFNLGSFLQRTPQTLSGGEQQKLALASILACKPRIFLFDEPLSMLDSTSAFELVALIESLIQRGYSALICEHRQAFLKDSSHFRPFKLPGLQTQPASTTESGRNSVDYPQLIDPFSLNVEKLGVKKSGHEIIRDMSFFLESGQVVAIVGRNGSGKTTLLRSLTGLQKYSGDVWVERGGEKQPPSFRMVFQNPDVQLFNATVREEILYKIPQPDMTRYEWLLQSLNLKHYEETPPLLLSEGEKRRLALASTLMQPMRHGILLDEPALGQDQNHKEILMNILHKLARAGFLVIFSTHDLELAAQADRLILINPGGIVAEGSSRDMIAAQSPWQEIGLTIPEWVRQHD